MAAVVDERVIRAVDVDVADAGKYASAIDQMYADQLDVLIVRRAIDPARLAALGAKLDADGADPGWARPNQRMPVEDIQVLGSPIPATPTYSAPTGASLEAYLEGAKGHHAATAGLFGDGFDMVDQFRHALGHFAGGRPVDVPVADDGRAYVPFTIRRLTDGKQIGLHHDYHYPLALYTQLAPRLDTRTLVSFVVILRQPDGGGELCVYAVTPQTPNPPKLPNGFQYDLAGVEQRFDHKTFATAPGDLFLLASGRCLHRISPVRGPRARISMGGFLAIEKDGRRVLCWS